MQLALPLKSPRGGKREGAGRKRKPNHDTDHKTRPQHPHRFPVHVTLRVKEDVKRLRRGHVLRKLRRALHVVAKREDVFRIVHLSIQDNHLHLLVEAENKDALARGVQSFAISAARAINRSQRRKGKVFAYRYHAREITNRRQTRNALAYVLNNWRRHTEDRTGRAARALLDPYSSAVVFDGWTCRFKTPDDFVPLAVKPGRTWLLTTGWQMHGAIDPREVPGRI